MKTKFLFLGALFLFTGWQLFQSKLGLTNPLFQFVATPPYYNYLPLIMKADFPHLFSLSITLGSTNTSNGISLVQGGDSDTIVVVKGNPPIETRATGNGQALPSVDGNTIPDLNMQFNVADNLLFQGQPTSRVRVEIDYFDSGTDTFSMQYDGIPGQFEGGGSVVKTNTNTFKTASFYLCDVYFGNRDNGADFRISDNQDGAEYIQAVRVIGLVSSSPRSIFVDDFGANPFDNNPDSDAIQAALDSSCSGDTIVFTSGISHPNYSGYLIDKTLFLTGKSVKSNLTFTSSDPTDHSLLQATAGLKGYVVRLYARSRFGDAGHIDNINFGYIDVNGGRNVRICTGANGVGDGSDDNWGSWLPECPIVWDEWCSPGNIAMDGGFDLNDITQNYQGNPSLWTTGMVVHDLTDQQTECQSALSFMGAASTIQNVVINTAGDHVHVPGCTLTDNDGDSFGFADGITLLGPGNTVNNNTIINPSDIGIVSFGGMNTTISNNTIQISSGNYGAFAGIGIHEWWLGDVSGIQITGNQLTSQGDQTCGGMHAGINIGPQMWGSGCVNVLSPAEYGNSVSDCSVQPTPATVGPCTGNLCELWAYLPSGSTFTLDKNTVTGAQINYLVDGFDILGTFVDTGNKSTNPQITDWQAAKAGCKGITWGALDRVAHNLSLPGYTDLIIQCER